jgi:apolipoprotein D and lipocalin family protein
MTRTFRILVLLSLAPATASATLTAAPPPRKAVDPVFFTGRWYEIARTDNWRQNDCEAPTYVFEPQRNPANAYFTLTCHRGAPTGKAEAARVTIKLPQDSQRNKFKVSGMGGLLSLEYSVLDVADDTSWSILATPGGGYVWILSRNPRMEPVLRDRLLGEIRAMGYDMDKIIQPKQA